MGEFMKRVDRETSDKAVDKHCKYQQRPGSVQLGHNGYHAYDREDYKVANGLKSPSQVTACREFAQRLPVYGRAIPFDGFVLV